MSCTPRSFRYIWCDLVVECCRLMLVCPAGEQVTVGQVSHHSIELIWTREHGTNWTDPPENWTCFILEQRKDRKHTYKQIHK